MWKTYSSNTRHTTHTTETFHCNHTKNTPTQPLATKRKGLWDIHKHCSNTKAFLF
nr:MAG TPA: hypothetical protein [Caudoviricetes sp.]